MIDFLKRGRSEETEERFGRGVFSPEVAQQGVVNNSFYEEYPFVFSFPLFSHDYNDYIADAVAQVLGTVPGTVLTSDLGFGIDKDLLHKVCENKLNDVIRYLYVDSRFHEMLSPMIYCLDTHYQTPDQVSLGDGDYTLLVCIENLAEGGHIFMPKKNTPRLRTLEMRPGQAILFPSVFEFGVTQIIDGSLTFLELPFTIS